MRLLSPEELERLKRIDSPTISNAIERLRVRPRVSGYASCDLRCAFPELDPMVGYALTCTADSTTEDRRDEGGLLRLWEALERAPKPAVLVMKDIGGEPSRSCHMGEVMATVAKALGAVGCISDGGVRDVREVQALGDFQYFCRGFVVSHGNPVICEIGAPVTLCGFEVAPGDLLHGDVNGVVVIPAQIADRIAEEAMRVRADEREVLELARRPGFTVEKLRRLKEGMRH